MPLSVTVKRSLTRPRAARDARTSSRTAPRSVNFTALSIKFSIAARNRAASPTSMSGRSAATVTSTVRPLVSARAASVSASASIRRRGRNACCCSVSAPASALVVSILAASMAKVVSAARCSALVLMPAAQRRSRSPRLELASNSPSARMPVSEVRMSCANAASAASVVRVAGTRRERRRERFAADFFLGFVRTMAAPRRRTHNATAADQTK